MNNLPDNCSKFTELIGEHRPYEAFVFFLEQVKNKSWSLLSATDLEMLDTLCQGALVDLREHHTLWMVNHPQQLRRMLKLLIEALAVNYHSAATVDHIAWLRCLLAIEAAMGGQIDRVHEELCLVRGDSETVSVPKPNGILRERIQSIELTEKSSAEFLRLFFASYVEFLRRIGQHELANHLDSRIGRLLSHIARDEKRPGVVQALFYDKLKAVGHSGFIHISMEHQPHDSTETACIDYARRGEDIIDPAMRDAATYAWQAVDAYLKRTGYPDGLDERLVRWEIGNLPGDTVELERQFQGGSVALPLAVAIVSEYLARPVPNDMAFTGALVEASVADGHVHPVDGILEKVEHAVLSGSRLVYAPAANLAELNGRPSLQNLISEHNAQVMAVETLNQVCEELFPPEGSGRLWDAAKDTAANLMQILHPAYRRKEDRLVKPTHERHRIHIIICSFITAALMFLEGWRLYKAFAPGHPSLAAWTRIIASTAIVLLGMLVCFGLPAAFLRHRKVWSWYAGIGILAVCFCAGIFILGPMLPDFVRISSIYNMPPLGGLLKDVFIIWLFAWGLGVNTFNAVAALEDLIAKRQFVTARTCLRWDSPLEARMTLRCVHFPWMWGALGIGAIAAYLIAWELNYYTTVDVSVHSGYWETLLGIVRDLFFACAIIEILVFYKAAIARIRTALG